MHKSLYTRPPKPISVEIPTYDEVPRAAPVTTPKIIEVPRSTECHITPAKVAEMMIDIALIEEGQRVLEPQAGTGALLAALIDTGQPALQIVAVEKEVVLADLIREKFSKNPEIQITNDCFLEYARTAVAPFDRVLMNPPFKHTNAHIAAALNLLKPSGILVALVQRTYTHSQAEEVLELPIDTFQSAKVHTKIIMITK